MDITLSVATQIIQYSCHIHLLEMHSRYERQNNNEEESSSENDLRTLISHLQWWQWWWQWWGIIIIIIVTAGVIHRGLSYSLARRRMDWIQDWNTSNNKVKSLILSKIYNLCRPEYSLSGVTCAADTIAVWITQSLRHGHLSWPHYLSEVFTKCWDVCLRCSLVQCWLCSAGWGLCAPHRIRGQRDSTHRHYCVI